MDIRYYINPATNQPHIYGHGVTEQERASEDRPNLRRPLVASLLRAR